MKTALKLVAYLSITPLLIGLFFFSNIKDYYRFKSYCEKEGGLRVYEKLDRNMGWLAKDYNEAHVAAQLNGVGFVRYVDQGDGKTYDIKYIGGDPQHENSFRKTPIDETESILYKWDFVRIYNVQNETRLSRSGYEIFMVKNNKLMARFYDFGYGQFENTLLGGSSKISCFEDKYEGFSALPYEFREIIKAFK